MAAFPFRTVVFDLDGTLADTAPDLTAALNYALETLGRARVPDEDVRHMVGHGARA
ncbi:MAG TPA: HAD hydrolase-like protein, partial [Sphingomonas sp.]|nr:HAD hydrolase-like protein [Sphingomonas sp.]